MFQRRCSKRCSKNICDFFSKQIRLSVQTRSGGISISSRAGREAVEGCMALKLVVICRI